MSHHHSLRPWLKWVLFLCALIALIFSFTQKFDATVNRIVGTYMNFGHVVAFFLWTYLCFRFVPYLAKARVNERLIFALLFAVIGGGLIEIIQDFVGRDASLFDMGSDLIGALLAALTFHFGDSRLKSNVRFSSIIILLLIASVMHRNLIFVPVNEYYQRQQFPVLFDPDTPFEMTRLYENAEREIIDDRDFGTVLKISFNTDKYSTVSLENFPYDWRGFNALEIEIYQREEDIWPLNIRIQDIKHSRVDEQSFDDRYNKRFQMNSMHQIITIPFHEMINAPKGRRMDIHEMESIWLFTASANQSRTLYVKQIRLR